jgi:hypothetical protein
MWKTGACARWGLTLVTGYVLGLSFALVYFSRLPWPSRLRAMIESHLGPFRLLCSYALGNGRWFAIAIGLAPLLMLTVFRRRLNRAGYLPVMCGVVIFLWLALGAIMVAFHHEAEYH